jgi:hypothetical protein
MASFALSYAMANLGWKFYMINASWNIIFFVVVYFYWVETRGIPLEQIAMKFGDLDTQDISIEGVSRSLEGSDDGLETAQEKFPDKSG